MGVIEMQVQAGALTFFRASTVSMAHPLAESCLLFSLFTRSRTCNRHTKGAINQQQQQQQQQPQPPPPLSRKTSHNVHARLKICNTSKCSLTQGLISLTTPLVLDALTMGLLRCAEASGIVTWSVNVIITRKHFEINAHHDKITVRSP